MGTYNSDVPIPNNMTMPNQMNFMYGNNNIPTEGFPGQNGSLAPSMMNPLQPRATIPETNGGSNSSFNFISNGSSNNQMTYSNSNLSFTGNVNNQGTGESEDAFGFVREAMKGK